jgi:hypothetical protein
MQKSKLAMFAAPIAAFVLGVVCCLFASPVLDRLIPAGKSQIDEVMRVSSPDGLLDGVMTQEGWGGAMGGFMWDVYIVPKGERAPIDERKAVFHADRLSKPYLLWNRPHLLEIGYNVAEIGQFRNLWTTYDSKYTSHPADQGYFVEVRLVPFSPDYSLLTPDGNFRQTY